MDTLRVVEFDVRGIKPINKIDLEEIPLKDKCPWVIPDGSPFFGDYPVNGQLPLTVVYDESGAEMVRDRDYWLEEEFIPLTEVTGRPIVCFVRLSDEILENNTKIKISYRSVGAYFVPRNSLNEWLTKIRNGVTPIPWSKVFNVPPTLPSSWHSHSIKTEIGDWFEFTWFFKYLENIISTRDPLIEAGIDAAIRAAFDKLYQTRDAQFQSLRAHGKNYNRPHGTTKGNVLLGNHDNFATGTIADHRQGTRADLFATVQGVQTVLEDAAPDTSGIVKNGLLPLSRFGTTGYIPPSITGSFEGLGSRSECMGMCTEADGRVIAIQNHYDGRTEGLYFSILSDAKKAFDPKNPYSFEFTAYKYEPPVLTNIGVAVDAIVMGSGNDIIMTGKTRSVNPAANDRWFVALTSNTFDPSSHRYIETNMANVFAECGAPNAAGNWGSGKTYHWQFKIDLMGDWVLLTVDAAPLNPGLYGQQGRIVRFRIPRQALLDGTPATWQLLKVTYQDYDGVQYTNVNSWNYATKVVSNNNVSKWGRYTFNQQQPPAGTGTFNYRVVNLYAKKSNAPGVYYCSWLGYTLLSWVVPVKGFNSSRTASHMVYEFNIETGVMTLVYKQLPLNVDFVNDTGGVVANTDLNKLPPFYGSMVRYHSVATIITPNGEKLTSLTAPNQELSPLNSIIEYHTFALIDGTPLNTAEKLLSGDLSYDRLKVVAYNPRSRNIQTPISIGVASRWTAYESDGENFMTQTTIAIDKSANLPYPEVVCREVNGGYAVRPAITNKQLAPMYSRPLTNKVYKTNMSNLEGVISGTGTDAELASRGVECGTMSLSACGFSSVAYPSYAPLTTFPSAAFRALNEQGAFLSFPKTFSKKLDVVTQRMMYTPNDYYGLAPGIKDKIRALIPAEKQGIYWTFSLFVLNNESGGVFQGMNKALLYVKYPTIASGDVATYDAQMFLVNLVVEAPTAAHPGCHLVTDFQIVGQSVVYLQHYGLSLGLLGGQVHFSNRPFFTFYRSGNVLKCFLTSGMTVFGGTFDCTVFDLNVSTGAFSQLGADHAGANVGDVVCAVPKVGLTRFNLTAPDTYNAALRGWTNTDVSNDPSGGSCRTMPVVRQDGGVDYYATITSYPEVGWSVFLLETVEVMFNGTLYKMPIGTIDLRDFDPSPQNKTFWLYATIEGQDTRYIISSTKLRKSNTLILSAIITTGANQILTIERRQSFMIGDLELSYTRQGGSIPVSSGFPQDDGSFIFLKAAELLP